MPRCGKEEGDFGRPGMSLHDLHLKKRILYINFRDVLTTQRGADPNRIQKQIGWSGFASHGTLEFLE